MAYDKENVFAKILRGELPCNKVFENEHVLAFHDIKPTAKVHILVLPKGEYTDIGHFAKNASDAEIVALFRAVEVIATQHNLSQHGYRIVSNTGSGGGQEVPHLHIHLMG